MALQRGSDGPGRIWDPHPLLLKDRSTCEKASSNEPSRFSIGNVYAARKENVDMQVISRTDFAYTSQGPFILCAIEKVNTVKGYIFPVEFARR